MTPMTCQMGSVINVGCNQLRVLALYLEVFLFCFVFFLLISCFTSKDYSFWLVKIWKFTSREKVYGKQSFTFTDSTMNNKKSLLLLKPFKDHLAYLYICWKLLLLEMNTKRIRYCTFSQMDYSNIQPASIKCQLSYLHSGKEQCTQKTRASYVSVKFNKQFELFIFQTFMYVYIVRTLTRLRFYFLFFIFKGSLFIPQNFGI